MSVQICRSFALECLQALHDLSVDTLKIALYDENATFGVTTTAYTTTNEIVTGSGYTTGGATLVLSSGYPQIENGAAAVRFDDVSWTFSATRTVRQALIYNSSKSNRAILAIDFGSVIVNGSFDLEWPLTTDPLIQLRFPT